MAYHDISGRLEIRTSSDQNAIIGRLVDSLHSIKVQPNIYREKEINFQVPFLKTVTRGYVLQGVSSGSIKLNQLQLNQFVLEYTLITLPMRIFLLFMALWVVVLLPGFLFFTDTPINIQSYALFALVGILFTSFAYFAGKFFVNLKFRSFLRRALPKDSEIVKQPVLPKSLDTKKVIVITCSGILSIIVLILIITVFSLIRMRPKILWRFPVGNTVMSAPVITEGAIYFGSLGDFKAPAFYALDTSTGEELWTKSLSGSATWSPVIADKMVYFSTDDGFFYCLDKETGKERWIFEPKQRNSTANSCDKCALKFSQPTIDNKFIYVGSLDHNLYALDAQTGVLQWHIPTNGSILDAPAISHNKVYFGSADGNIYVVEPRTGKEIRRYYIPNPGYENGGTGVYATPLVDTTTIYAVTGNLVALDIETGIIKWQFSSLSPMDEIIGTPLMFENQIIITKISKLYALDKTTGEINWQFSKIKGNVFFSPIMNNGVIYFGDSSGYLYVINAKTGRQIRKYNTSDVKLKTN